MGMGRAVLVVAALLAACTGDDGEPLTVGDEAPTAGVATTGTSGGDDTALAVPRCDDVPRLDAAPVDGPLSDDPEVAAWQQQRADYGLPSDEASTRAAAASPRSPDAASYGNAITDEEAVAFEADNSRLGDLAGPLQGELIDVEPTFAGLWIDNGRRQVTAAFTEGVAARQAEYDERFGPGVVRVIEVERSSAELAARQEEVGEWLRTSGIRFNGTSSGVLRNAVEIFLFALDPADIQRIADEVGSEGLCVSGAEPAEVVPEGPQPLEGDGWRLLADEPGAGVPYDTGFARDDVAYEALWAEIGLDAPRPAVDFGTEVVVWFGPAVSGSCADIRLDGISIDAAEATLFPLIVLPGGARGCTGDANPHAYVVAVQRTALPGDRFTITLGEGTPPSDCCPEATTEVDLRAE